MSQMSNHLSEQYVRQQDLASCSNQCSSREGILAGMSSASTRKHQSYGAPKDQKSNEFNRRMTGSIKSLETRCGLQCRDESSRSKVAVRSNAGMSSSPPRKYQGCGAPSEQNSNEFNRRKEASSKSLEPQCHMQCKDESTRSRVVPQSNAGSTKSLGTECHIECVDEPCSRIDVQRNTGSPTLSGRQEPPACSSTCSGPKEGSSQDRKVQKASAIKYKQSITSQTKDSCSTGCMPVDSSAPRASQADILHELEVCKELLRVQCSLNASFKNELTKLYAEIAKLEGSTSGSSATLSNSLSNESKPDKTTPSQDGMRRKSLLRVGEGEGLFEIHAHCIELSEEGSIQIPPDRAMFLTWAFFDQEVAYTPLKKGPKAEINTSAVYRVHVDDTFLEHLHTEVCYVDLHASKDDSSELVGRGMLKFSEILDFPQNKLHSSVRLLSVKPCEEAHTLGMLQCWFRLSCDLSIINKFNEGRIPSPKSYESPVSSGTDGIQSGKGSNESEPDNQPEVASSGEDAEGQGVGRSFSEDSVELSDESNKHSDESNKSTEQMENKEIFEFEKIEIVDDAPEPEIKEVINEPTWNKPVEVKEVKEVKVEEEDPIATTSGEELQRQILAKLDRAAEHKPVDSMESDLNVQVDGPLVLTIEIHTFVPDLTADYYFKANVIQVYVEFKFLGLSGRDLETKSVHIQSGTLAYNYRKSFNYSAADQQQMLVDMYQGTTWHDTALQFVIVSEPHEDESTGLDCEEIGYADVDMKQLIGRGRDLVKSDVKVYGADGKSADIGTLNISILGMPTCRKAVLAYIKQLAELEPSLQ